MIKMRSAKMWRTRLKPLISSLILFGLGVTTCLMFVQMSQSEVDGPAVYTNSQEYQSPQQLILQQQQTPQHVTPCDTSVTGTSHHFQKASSKKRRRVALDNSDYQQKSSEPQGIKSSAHNEILKNNDITYNSNNEIGDSDDEGPRVWVVTPTFYRPEQKPELTRLAQALLPLRHFVYWVLVEDISHGSNHSFTELEHFMKKFSDINYTILKSLPPKQNTKIVGRPRGVGGRRAAIDWLRKQYEDDKRKSEVNDVVYFADDDNTYDSDIFRQMRWTKKVSMWPVGLVTDFGVSSPIVQNGKVVGFYDGWSGLRKFPVDMAGFAINIQLFLEKPNANMPFIAGYEEDELLKSLGITMKDIKPLANNCSEILVWHTKAIRHAWPKRPKTMKPGLLTSTNLLQLLSSLPQKSLAGPAANNKGGDTGFSFLNMIFGGN